MLDRTVIASIIGALKPHSRILFLVTILSVAASFASIAGIATFLPVLSVLSEQDMEPISRLPVLGEAIPYLPSDVTLAVVTMVCFLFVMITIRAAVEGFILITRNRIKNAVDSQWQKRVLSHWLSLSPAQQARLNRARVTYLCDQEIRHIGQGAGAAVQLSAAAVQTLIIFLFLASVSWKILALMVAFVTLISLPTTWLIKRLLVQTQRDAHLIGGYGQRILELIRRTDLVNIFRTQDREIDTIGRFFRDYLTSRLALERTRVITPKALEVSSAFMLCSVLIFVASTETGPAAVAQLVIFVGGVIALQPQLAHISGGIGQIGRVGAAIRQVNEIVHVVPEKVSGDRDTPPPHFDIELDTVSFRYNPGDEAVLDKVSAHIPEGKLTLLFGPSGAGKTTFLRLLQRLLTTSDGQIRLGGVPIDTFSPDVWSQLVLLMPQDAPLFSGTAMENIAYGTVTPDGDVVAAAARRAGADDFLERLPDGYKTDVGSDGGNLSGGQRQRVALARVLAQMPRVLILDEPTSALDRHIEQRVLRNLLELRAQGVTIVMSTHKIDLAPHADHLLWFSDGAVHEGSFQDFEHELASLFPLISPTDATALPASAGEGRGA